jgi:TBC1 domain family protein 5
LLFHTTDSSIWSAILADSRSAYSSLREHFLRYVERPEEIESAIDPLDDDKNVSHDCP